MPNTNQDELLRVLKARVAQGDLESVAVAYRVTGGAPGEGHSREGVHFSSREPPNKAEQTSAVSVTPTEMRALLLEIEEGFGELTPRSEARFIPDSLVGQITVTVGGREESYFFLADEEQAKQQGQERTPKLSRLLRALERLNPRSPQP